MAVSKALVPLFYPLGLTILLLGIAVLTWRRVRAARLFCAGALCLLVIFSSPVVSDALLRSLEESYPDQEANAAPDAQVIVVLGGAVHIPNAKHTGSGVLEPTDRVLRAFRLYRAGKAPLILCSGGNNPLVSGPGRMPESHAMRGLLEEWGVPPGAILVEDRSISTRENAVFSFQMLGAKNIRHILLVTSAAHMPRAAGAFRRVGFEVTPMPADFRTGWGDPSLAGRWIPSAGALMLSDQALKEWLALAVYRLRGWI